MPAILSYEVYQALQEVYQVHAPALSQYKGKESHEAELRELEQIIISSDRFKDVVFEQAVSEVTYNVDKYLKLLSTFSQYLELDAKSRNALFEGLQHKIDKNFVGCLQLFNLSAFHVARKN